MRELHLAIYRSFRFIGCIFLIGVGLLLPSSMVMAQQSADFSAGLFADFTPRAPITISAEASRARIVEINLQALGIADINQPPAATLPLNLFDDVNLLATFSDVQRNPSGSVTWSGKIAGDAYSHVNLIVRDGIMIGALAYGLEQYAIRLSPEGVQYVMQVGQSIYPEIETDAIPIIGESSPPKRVTNRGIDDGSIMDVIVGYTPEARVGAGSVAAIESTIELAVQRTNIAYKNSGAAQRVMLVHMFETADGEEDKSTSTLLTEWRTSGDDRFEEVFALRDTYHGDFAHLITEVGGCGVAYFQGTPNDASFESWAFGQTTRSCAISGYTFAHELGHNMGLNHDWYVSSATTPYPYAHGFTNYQNRWRTIMAYNNRCGSAAGGIGSCSRLLYFSNPSNSYNGDPMGVSGTTPANCVVGSTSPEPESCVANATSVLNSQRVSNSQFRVSQITWTGDNGTNWNDAGNWEIVQGPANRPFGATTTVNRVPLSVDDVVIPSNLANYPTISGGSVAAREVVIQTGATLKMTSGTLTVSGMRWEEQGSGQFNATGGNVVFHSTIDQEMTVNANSTFPNVQFGGGNTQTIGLNSDLDINGDLTLAAGVLLTAGNHTIRVSGDWTDNGNGFSADTSTVIFDGTSQTVNKVTTSTLLSENFDAYIGSCCTSSTPSGWGREAADGFGFAQGEQNAYPGNGTANRWWDSTDAWLFTPGYSLTPELTYQLEYQYAANGSGTQTISASYGTAQGSGGMTNINSQSTNSSSLTTVTTNFTVGSAATYYLGLRGQQASTGGYAILDDIVLRAIQDITFYDVQVAAGTTMFGGDVVVKHNLQTDLGGSADFGTNTVSVEGTVTNNGSLKQTKTAANNTTTEFLRIRNAANATNKYYGVEVTPSTGSMGTTAVEIKGAQTCEASGIVGNGVQRCYVITPATNRTSDVRFYYKSAEANTNTTPDVYLQTGARAATWTKQTTSAHGGTGDAVWATASGLSSYGTFALARATPTVTLTGITAQDEGDSGNVTYTFTATLNLAVSGGFTLPYTVSDGTATTGDGDYTDNDGTLTFNGTAGETQTFMVNVFGDTVIEGNETFVVALGSPSNSDVTVSGSPLTATIIGDDGAMLSSNYPNGAPGSNFIVTGKLFAPNSTVTLTLSWPSRSTETVIGTVMSDGNGDFTTNVQTSGLSPAGAYLLNATDSSNSLGGSGTTGFALSVSAETRTDTAGGQTTITVGLPFSVYIPIVIR